MGTLYLDQESAELVRFRFSFTPAAYLDRQLEDISIVLENARFEGRYWLPYRQEVEIRRRTTGSISRREASSAAGGRSTPTI